MLRKRRRPGVGTAAAAPRAAVFFMAVFVVGLCASVAAAVHAAWIPLKAELAQRLLQYSWSQQLAGKDVPPWPWADTHAIAELSIERLQVRQVVLEGSSGRNLAFGPTRASSEASTPDWIIHGHRDTHFRFLQQLRRGDELQLETAEGVRMFRVDSLEVIDSRHVELVLDPGVHRLSLVTCYPFDAVTTGGPLRYVVTALPVPQAGLSRPAASSG
jgi:sortase A